MISKLAVGVCAAVLGCTLSGSARAEGTPRWGGFGHAFAGVVGGSLGDIEQDLRAPEALGRYSLSPVAAQVGGGGWAMFAGSVMLGGRGWGIFAASGDAERGKTSFSGGGGGFDLGWALYNRSQWLLFPYVGVGGFGYGVEIANTTPTLQTGGGDVTVGTLTIAPGQSARLRGGGGYFELGVGGQRLLFDAATQGGFMVGAEIGGIVSFGTDGWLDDNDGDVGGVSPPALDGVYVKLTLGGGGFFYSK